MAFLPPPWLRLWTCLPNFQCFQSCVPWTPFCIFSFCYFSYAVVSGTHPWVAVS